MEHVPLTQKEKSDASKCVKHQIYGHVLRWNDAKSDKRFAKQRFVRKIMSRCRYGQETRTACCFLSVLCRGAGGRASLEGALAPSDCLGDLADAHVS